MKKKVCIVTAARSEYGLLRWVIDYIQKEKELDLQLIVAGGHLSVEQGLTYQAIESDGYPIDAKVEMLLSSDTETALCKSMGLCCLSITEHFERLKPDVIVVLGDRYELLPICSTAVVMNIPIAHISGGDVTEGAIDNKVRNAVTMLSTYHFPGTEESASRIKKMIGTDKHVYVTGETNLDNFRLLPALSRETLAGELGLDANKEWVLCTYHAETLLSLEDNIERVKTIYRLFIERLGNFEIVISKSNADYGGIQINMMTQEFCKVNKHCHLFDSLGLHRYISMLSQVRFMIGNSSSGIFESPVVGTPVINIGDRQRGRLLTENIHSASGTYDSILACAEEILDSPFKAHIPVKNPYGDGRSSERIVSILNGILNNQ
ncbi:MAG: UDP-N-acetylglucosamine 2-epimerase [Bacteroidales bacterium]|nr:UDP-N-acetylglucosamine 2-epimerase [Bacteroidales bacterium]